MGDLYLTTYQRGNKKQCLHLVNRKLKLDSYISTLILMNFILVVTQSSKISGKLSSLQTALQAANMHEKYMQD